MKATVIPQDTFNDLQVDAGVLLSAFDITTQAITDANIITATTGGIHVICTPTYSDFFEDVDNAPNNTKEGKHLDGWDCRLETTSLNASVDGIKFALGVADLGSGNTSKIVPRAKLEQTDFEDAIWWVGDRADGGLVAVKLLNALSTGGFDLQTGKNSKGQVTLSITGHVSVNAQSVVPMEFYSLDAEGTTGET